MDFNKKYTKVHVKGKWVTADGIKDFDDTYDITEEQDTYVIYLEENNPSTIITVCFAYNMTRMDWYSLAAAQTNYYVSKDYLKLNIIFDTDNNLSSDMIFGQGSYMTEYNAYMGYANYGLTFAYSV